jgi:glycosyltransferase involved in cell wall biosynthesis
MVQALVDHAPRLAPDLRFRLIGSPETPPLAADKPNVEQVTVRAAANSPATMWWLPRLVDLRDVQLFHATFNIMPAGLSMPCVTTIHDIMWLDQPELCDASWKRPARAAFMAHGIKRAIHKSAAIATVSEATKTAISAYAPDAGLRTSVTLSGVNPRFQRTVENKAALATLELDPKRRFILTVGQYAPYKNHEGALAAFARIAAMQPDLDLVFVQRQGPHARALNVLAEQHGLGDRVHFLREVAADALIQLYGHATLLLHPSFCEGFGNPLAEAMACGCPVVTSSMSAMPEVTAGAALLADPNDAEGLAQAMVRVIGEPGCAHDMRQRGLARASELRWEGFAAANVALYRRLLA